MGALRHCRVNDKKPLEKWSTKFCAYYMDVISGSRMEDLTKMVIEAYLPPTKIKRKYTCAHCGYVTINPRMHLRHRVIAHGDKIKIVECPLCVYACQYRQKLNRHLKLVHQLDPPYYYCLPFQVTNGETITDSGSSLEQMQQEPLDLSRKSLGEEKTIGRRR